MAYFGPDGKPYIPGKASFEDLPVIMQQALNEAEEAEKASGSGSGSKEKRQQKYQKWQIPSLTKKKDPVLPNATMMRASFSFYVPEYRSIDFKCNNLECGKHLQASEKNNTACVTCNACHTKHYFTFGSCVSNEFQYKVPRELKVLNFFCPACNNKKAQKLKTHNFDVRKKCAYCDVELSFIVGQVDVAYTPYGASSGGSGW